MGRPTYENGKTMDRERRVLKYIKKHAPHWHYGKLPRSFEIDYAAFSDDKRGESRYTNIERLFEIKTYTRTLDYLVNTPGHDYFIAAHKVEHILRKAEFLKTKGRLFAAWDCGTVGYLDDEQLRDHRAVSYDGRTDRNDPADKEIVVEYDREQFEIIRRGG